MRRLFFVSSLFVTLSLLNSSFVFGACTVDVANTGKFKDEVIVECVWNSPSNAYIIV
jgi:hypothetical protein